MKQLLLTLSLLLLFAVEISRVYFIMPFPGSQQSNSIGFAYWLARNIGWIRIVLLVAIAIQLMRIFRSSANWKKAALSVVLIVYAVIFYFFNFRFEADKMFYQPTHTVFNNVDPAAADSVLVIGVALNGEAKAYPIQIIGYHHQVKDSIGHIPAIITYCTVCRTGRVYSPNVDGHPETFRLVGMDHFNAMFEDATTKSWWQQATGIAIAGPLKGKALTEIPSQQLSLSAWLRLHPDSKVMAPDTIFNRRYMGLFGYNKGTINGSLEKRDSGSWKAKSWIVGIVHEGHSKAYDWNELVSKQIIQDSMPGLPVLLAVERDTASFHAWSRKVNGQSLKFETTNTGNELRDLATQSIWNMNGRCTGGVLKGEQLTAVQCYQEFWHSWKNFHPATLVSR